MVSCLLGWPLTAVNMLNCPLRCISSAQNIVKCPTTFDAPSYTTGALFTVHPCQWNIWSLPVHPLIHCLSANHLTGWTAWIWEHPLIFWVIFWALISKNLLSKFGYFDTSSKLAKNQPTSVEPQLSCIFFPEHMWGKLLSAETDATYSLCGALLKIRKTSQQKLFSACCCLMQLFFLYNIWTTRTVVLFYPRFWVNLSRRLSVFWNCVKNPLSFHIWLNVEQTSDFKNHHNVFSFLIFTVALLRSSLKKLGNQNWFQGEMCQTDSEQHITRVSPNCCFLVVANSCY